MHKPFTPPTLLQRVRELRDWPAAGVQGATSTSTERGHWDTGVRSGARPRLAGRSPSSLDPDGGRVPGGWCSSCRIVPGLADVTPGSAPGGSSKRHRSPYRDDRFLADSRLAGIGVPRGDRSHNGRVCGDLALVEVYPRRFSTKFTIVRKMLKERLLSVSSFAAARRMLCLSDAVVNESPCVAGLREAFREHRR